MLIQPRWMLRRFGHGHPGEFPSSTLGVKLRVRQAWLTHNAEPESELLLNRMSLAFRAFWKTLTDANTAPRIEEALLPPQPGGPDLRILALLQRDGRLIDFLQEEIDSYTDSQIGAAVRDIHKGCRNVLKEYITLSPVIPQEEGQRVAIENGFDPAFIRLSGNVAGKPPFQGVLKHHGWRVASVRLPNLPGLSAEGGVIAPAEVEVG